MGRWSMMRFAGGRRGRSQGLVVRQQSGAARGSGGRRFESEVGGSYSELGVGCLSHRGRGSFAQQLTVFEGRSSNIEVCGWRMNARSTSVAADSDANRTRDEIKQKLPILLVKRFRDLIVKIGGTKV